MKAKERPLRVGPFTADRQRWSRGSYWVRWRGRPVVYLTRADQPALARLVAKMQAAESRRGKVRR